MSRREEFLNACENGNIEVVKLLLPYLSEADIKSLDINLLGRLCAEGYTAIVELLISYLSEEFVLSKNNYAFRCACWNNRLDIIQLLIDTYPSLEEHSLNKEFQIIQRMPPK